MGNRVAAIKGTFLRPGVSKNKRLYTAENIQNAVARMQEQLASPDGLPLTMATSHGAAYNDDALSMVGRVTNVFQDVDGAAHFEADIANTTQGKDVATLISGDSPFLKSISIRGEWLGELQTVEHQGQQVATASDFKVSGIDFTSRPGVTGATLDGVTVFESAPLTETAIHESFSDFQITEDIFTPSEKTISISEFQDKFADFIESFDSPADDAENFADRGYLSDGKKRLPIESEKQVRAAWSYINESGNANAYSSAQLKRVKSRIKSAAKKFNIDVQEEYNTFLNELQEVVESYVSINVDNGPASIGVTGYASDPTQLRALIAQLAATATAALVTLDPDEDGDIDNIDPDDDSAGKSSNTDSSEGAEAETQKANGETSLVPPLVDASNMYCGSCNGALPESASYCPACGVSVPTNESAPDGSNDTKESIVADTETVTEEATTEVPEVPARSLTEADITTLATVISEAVAAAVVAATPIQEQAPVEAETSVAEAEVEVEAEATESTQQEGDMAETYSADDVSNAVAEALASFKDQVAEAVRDNGAPRKGMVGNASGDGALQEEYSAEDLATMNTRQFREAQVSVWGDIPFFRDLWNRADSNAVQF